jgi:hypothetical protein
VSETSIDAGAQADTLVAEIRARSAAEGRVLRDAADAEARAILRSAREKAQRQLARTRVELVAARRRRLAQVAAELDSARRQRESARALHLLADVWPRLATDLARRWRDIPARQRWIAAVLDAASARLLARDWSVRHPHDLDAAGCADLRAQLARRGVAQASLVADASVSVGLVVESGGARLDGTANALLADRTSVEAALLGAVATGVPGMTAR